MLKSDQKSVNEYEVLHLCTWLLPCKIPQMVTKFLNMLFRKASSINSLEPK
jgi:hypothetical protein